MWQHCRPTRFVSTVRARRCDDMAVLVCQVSSVAVCEQIAYSGSHRCLCVRVHVLVLQNTAVRGSVTGTLLLPLHVLDVPYCKHGAHSTSPAADQCTS